MTALAADPRPVVPGGPAPRGLPPAVALLCLVVAVASAVAAAAGLAWPGGGVPATVTSLRGEEVALYGEGLYRWESAFKGGSYRGADLVTLALAVPLLLAALARARRGSLPALLLLAGTLSWTLYSAATLSVAAVYNPLFLLYVLAFSSSLFALGGVLATVPLPLLDRRLEGRAPRVGLSRLLAVAGVVTAGVWLLGLVPPLVAGEPPAKLDLGVTAVTEALDLAVITPAALWAAWLLARRRPLGYLVGVPLVVLLVALLPVVVSQTAFQLAAGVTFTPGEVVGPISGFLVLAAVALPLLVRTLRAAAAEPVP